MYLLAAISLGFLGSFHCIGMCGPIALSLPINQKNKVDKVLSILAYNAGRVITYALFGAIFGLMGQSFALFGFQQILSIILGSLILIVLIAPFTFTFQNNLSRKFYDFFYSLKTKISKQFQKKGIQSLFTIGLLNGLLPCGFVYIAIAGAITTGSIYKGILFMSFFGLGTIPFMFSISFYSNIISLKARNIIRKSMPIVIGMMATLLIVRGMNLGIPYLSPRIADEKKSSVEAAKKTIKCCHK